MFTMSIVAMVFLSGLLITSPLKAQPQVSFNMNISSQALWGPVGYDHVDYYYFPEIDVFYNVPTQEFIYPDGPNWVFVPNLPPRFHVDLYSTYKVVVNQPKPYLRHDIYKVKYAKYKRGGPKQHYIRDSRDQRYFKVNGHPRFNKGDKNEHQSMDSRNHREKNAERSDDRQNRPSREAKGKQKGHKGK